MHRAASPVATPAAPAAPTHAWEVLAPTADPRAIEEEDVAARACGQLPGAGL